MNEKKKFRLKLNVFDIVIIALVVVAGIVFFAVTNTSRSGSDGVKLSSGTSTTVRYVIELTGMMEDASNKVEVGDTIIDRIEKRTLGKVVAVTIEPTRLPFRDQITGAQVIEEQPDRYTAIITLESPAAETASSITVDGGFIVRAGLPVTVNGPGYAGMGFILSVEREG